MLANEIDRELLRYQLDSIGMRQNVVFANDALEAQKWLDSLKVEEGPQLAAIFIDLHLPIMGAIDFLKAVRACPKHSNISVIVMTSSTSPSELVSLWGDYGCLLSSCMG